MSKYHPTVSADADNPVFVINPRASYLDITNAIDQRLAQARGILTAITSDDAILCLAGEVTHGAIWAVASLVQEVTSLYERQHELWVWQKKDNSRRAT